MMAAVISYVRFVLSLYVPHLSFIWCLMRAVLLDWDISWLSSLIFSISEEVLIFQAYK